MNFEDKKMIIFECDTNENLGNTLYVKFLDYNNKTVMIYNPVIAPRNFKYDLNSGNILKAYEITDYDVLKENEDKIYTLKKQKEAYELTKGIELEKKRILLMDSGMNLKLNLPIFSYEIIKDGFKIFPVNEGNGSNSFCYVINDDEVPEDLKSLMLPVVESIPGILSVNTYPYKPGYAYRKRR